jgi:hypothetical protein
VALQRFVQIRAWDAVTLFCGILAKGRKGAIAYIFGVNYYIFLQGFHVAFALPRIHLGSEPVSSLKRQHFMRKFVGVFRPAHIPQQLHFCDV